MNRKFKLQVFAFFCASILVACAPQATPSPAIKTVELVRGFLAAYDARDAEKLITYYSQDARAYDAGFPETAYYFSDIENVFRYNFAQGGFSFTNISFFTSDDGNFAALLGIYSEGNIVDAEHSNPSIILLQFKEGKITWEFDGYGGKGDGPLPPMTIPESANQPASARIVDQTKAAIEKWKTAHNSRNAQEFLSLYTEQVEYKDIISPAWRALTRKTLEEEVNANFNDRQYQSQLESFFVSPNGRFAAARGTYQDQKTPSIPMIVILEIENGMIIKQYNYRG
jgi:ketosteroid isomerase-like protein